MLIADDQVLIRAGLAAILRATAGYEVVGEATDGEEAVAMARATRPDVVLMDVRMPESDGISATRRILDACSDDPPKVLILTVFDHDEYVYEALRAGASGFLLKDTPPERLLPALRSVADGDMLFSPTVTRRLVESYCATRAPEEESSEDDGAAGAVRLAAEGTEALTARETDVLRLVAAGLSNGEIAERLVVTEGTVKTHLNRAMSKLNLSSRAQAVVLAYESGLVVPRRAAEGPVG
ncbi:DNA-binding response regulator [Mangrovactinospora gilvigrisea]|uniref:DNA-binding response regulator n=1 Tax=Mangrovactinospora gilvigrisea TaxID=1428644 RepID=A0A1J7BHG9_9ACTN|nr:DNA-binding response regulator [Mangrovactinospora gilvigrisea]